MTTPRQDDNNERQPTTSRPGRTWGIRLLAAIVLGVGIGAVVGVMGVRTLEPGNPGTPDSLQMLLDSVANARVAASEKPAEDTAPTRVDTVATAVDTSNVHSVPNLADLDEGEARQTLEDLGFDVGEILFRRSPKRAGTVLSTFPVAGERITQPATVNLILSDGRGPPDSLFVSTAP